MNCKIFRMKALVLIGVLFFTVSFVYAETAEECFSRGVTYAQQSNWSQAVPSFTKAIEMNPNYAEAYIGRGNAYHQQDNFIKAISDYDKAIEMNPNIAELYGARGGVYADQGNFSQAISDCTKAIEMKSTNLEDVYNIRGFAYIGQGNFNQAISDLTKSIEINLNHADSYGKRSIAYYHAKEYDKAWADMHKAESLGYKVNPDFLDKLKKDSGMGR